MEIALIIVLVVLVVLAIVVIVQFNRLRTLAVACDEGLSQIDVQLQRRADLIPNLVETVKGYASHERKVFEDVTKARAAVGSAKTVNEIAAADNQLTAALRGLLAVAEAYPDLKASANFIQLQEELGATENRVAFARQYYNDQVRAINTALTTIPGNFIGPLAKVGEREFYEVEEVSDRATPEVKFA